MKNDSNNSGLQKDISEQTGRGNDRDSTDEQSLAGGQDQIPGPSNGNDNVNTNDSGRLSGYNCTENSDVNGSRLADLDQVTAANVPDPSVTNVSLICHESRQQGHLGATGPEEDRERKLGSIHIRGAQEPGAVACTNVAKPMKEGDQEQSRQPGQETKGHATNGTGTLGSWFDSARNENEPIMDPLCDIQPLPSPQTQAPTMPGAFPETGLGLQQDNSNRASDSELTRNNTSEALYSMEHGNSVLDLDLEQQPSSAGLVQALPVTSELRPIEEMEVAEPMDESSKRRQRGRQQTRCFLLAGALMLLVVLAIVIGLVVRSGSQEASDDLVGTTLAPSAAPTQEALMSLLPAETQDVIWADPDASQSQAYQWMMNDPHFAEYTEDRLVQRFALATFYFSTNGPDWKHQGGGTTLVMLAGRPPPGTTGSGGPPPGQHGPGISPQSHTNVTREAWLDYDTNECDWFSTVPICRDSNTTQEADSLALHANFLAGSLPEEIGLLSSLRRFQLFQGSIQGTIPSTIGNLANLERLLVNGNKLVGTIPSEIGRLAATLSMLSFVDNDLVGSLPSQLWKSSNLLALKVMKNRLTGTIPSGACDMLPRLVSLELGDNMFSGSLPPSIGHCTSLGLLDVSKNTMTGALPTELGLLKSVHRIMLNSNAWSGTLPSQLGALPGLKSLWMHDIPQLSGSIPQEWGLLGSTLWELKLSGTTLTGTIPPGLCNIQDLQFDCSPNLCGCECSCVAP